MKKRVLALTLAMAMILALCVSAWAAQPDAGESAGEAAGESAEAAGESAGEAEGGSDAGGTGGMGGGSAPGAGGAGGPGGAGGGGGALPSGGNFGDVKTGVINNAVIIIDTEGVIYDESAADVFEIAEGADGITEEGVSGLHLENDSVYNNRNDGENTQGITGVAFVDVSGTLGAEEGFYDVTEGEDPLERPSVSEGTEYNTVIILDDEDAVFSRQGAEIADGAAVAIGGGTEENILTVDNAFIWTSGFKRTSLFADDQEAQLLVRNSRIICPGADNYKLGWQALYGGSRCTLLQNGDCWFYNDEVVTEGWGALAIDSSPGLDLYAVNCDLDTVGGGYISYTPGDGSINFYGVQADSAQYGVFVTGNSKAYMHAITDADETALLYFTEEDAEAENVTEDGKTVITADYSAYLTHQGGGNSPTTAAYLFAENTVLSTENVYEMSDNSHFLNDNYGGTSWFWTAMWRGSTCLCRSTNATFEFDNVELISRTGVVFRTVVNWEGTSKDFTLDAETEAVGNSLIMRNMDVEGDIRNDDIYRNLYVDITDASVTGAFVSTTAEGWNEMFSKENLEASEAYKEAEEMIAAWAEGEVPNPTYDAEYPYADAVLDLAQVEENMTMPDNGVLNGIYLTLNDGAVWNVNGNSQVVSLVLLEGAEVNAEGYSIYVNCDGFDASTGELVEALAAGEYANVVIIAE